MPCPRCGLYYDGEVAFFHDHYCKCNSPGVTHLPNERLALRDQFAAAASYTLEDWPNSMAEFEEAFGKCPDGYMERTRYYAKVEALIRYVKADAMLSERNREKG